MSPPPLNFYDLPDPLDAMPPPSSSKRTAQPTPPSPSPSLPEPAPYAAPYRDPRETRPSLFLRLRDGARGGGAAREIAWDEFRRRYAPIIAGFARNLGARPQDVDDVVQDVLFGFFHVSPRFVYDPSKGRFRGYLKVCTMRSVRAKLGQNAKFRSLPLEQVTDADLEVEQAWNDVWEQEQLRRAIDDVREHYRGRSTFLAFEQYVILSKDPQSVAASLGINVESVYKAKERVTKALRERLKALAEEEG